MAEGMAGDIGMSLLKQRFPPFARVLDGMSILIVKDGKLLKERMEKERIDDEDVLEAAREKHGLSRMDQIKHAVLECNGSISTIPRREGAKTA